MKKKKLVICASVFFEKEILVWKEKINKDKYEVVKYPLKINGDNFLEEYKQEFSNHYKEIMDSDVLLALNLEKKGQAGYIGAGVFAEMAFAVGLNQLRDKKIEVFYINHIPENSLAYSDELKLWQELGWIRQFSD